MWAATAAPVRLLNSSRQAMTAPVSDLVSVAVNVPRAAPTSPFGVGVSSEAVSVAVTWIRVAWLRAPTAPAIARATPIPPAMTSKTNFFTGFPLLRPGSQIDPSCPDLRKTPLGGLLLRRRLWSRRRRSRRLSRRRWSHRWHFFRVHLALGRLEVRRLCPLHEDEVHRPN